jgi:hypothetical protein
MEDNDYKSLKTELADAIMEYLNSLLTPIVTEDAILPVQSVGDENANVITAAGIQTADGADAAGIQPADGADAASIEPADGADAASIEPADEADAASIEPADGADAAGIEPADGADTASIEPADEVVNPPPTNNNYLKNKGIEINAQKQKDKAMNYEYPDPIQYLQYIHENTPLLLNMAIGKYVYRIVLENDQRNRFILTESFVDNASGKRFLHVLAVSIPPPPAKPIIEYLGKSDQNGKSLFYVSPEPILPIPIDIENVQSNNPILQQNNTEMNKATIDKIRLAEQKKGDLFYIPTETYNTENTIPECEKMFDRKNLSLVYKHLPVFIEKYLGP